MSWTLYELSRHPEVQASLREEVLSVLGGRSIPVAADVSCMPLLKATIKEVLRYNSKGSVISQRSVVFNILLNHLTELLFSRLYPVIPANARVITERDIQVGGYLIPKNVSVFGDLLHLKSESEPTVLI